MSISSCKKTVRGRAPFILLCTFLGISLPALAALNPAASPGRNFDLSRWKLTMPSGDEHSPAELESGFQYAGVFFTDPETGGMSFRCPNRAGTTPNTQYSRTELREMLDPAARSAKADSNNWTSEDGALLRAKLRVDQVSTTGDARKMGRVIVGQIHGDDSEPVRLYYDKKPHETTGRLYVGMETAEGDNVWSPDIVDNEDGEGIALGENFTYQIRLKNSALSVTIYRGDGEKVVYSDSIDPDYRGENMYFRAGVYNQNNTGSASDYVQVTFLILEHSHSG